MERREARDDAAAGRDGEETERGATGGNTQRRGEREGKERETETKGEKLSLYLC